MEYTISCYFHTGVYFIAVTCNQIQQALCHQMRSEADEIMFSLKFNGCDKQSHRGHWHYSPWASTNLTWFWSENQSLRIFKIGQVNLLEQCLSYSWLPFNWITTIPAPVQHQPLLLHCKYVLGSSNQNTKQTHISPVTSLKFLLGNFFSPNKMHMSGAQLQTLMPDSVNLSLGLYSQLTEHTWQQLQQIFRAEVEVALHPVLLQTVYH